MKVIEVNGKAVKELPSLVGIWCYKINRGMTGADLRIPSNAAHLKPDFWFRIPTPSKAICSRECWIHDWILVPRSYTSMSGDYNTQHTLHKFSVKKSNYSKVSVDFQTLIPPPTCIIRRVFPPASGPGILTLSNSVDSHLCGIVLRWVSLLHHSSQAHGSTLPCSPRVRIASLWVLWFPSTVWKTCSSGSTATLTRIKHLLKLDTI